jgi:hypothetical protein
MAKLPKRMDLQIQGVLWSRLQYFNLSWLRKYYPKGRHFHKLHAKIVKKQGEKTHICSGVQCKS